MSALALALVLCAAVLHATWNLLAKRAGGGGSSAIPFVWLVGTVGTVVYAPFVIALLVLRRPTVGLVELGFIAGSGLIHLAYFLLLQRGYRSGDLSLVYPLARGTGPALSTAAAVLLLGERPSPLALAGAALVVASVVIFATSSSSSSPPAAGARDRAPAASAGRSIAFGVGTGVLIAAYTLWDRHAVAALAISPLLVDWAGNVSRTLLLAPGAARRWDDVRALWRAHPREVVAVATLGPLGYIMVLVALTFTPVSYVAPAREMSILFGAAMGAHFLGERHARRRLIAAAVMVAGVVALAVG